MVLVVGVEVVVGAAVVAGASVVETGGSVVVVGRAVVVGRSVVVVGRDGTEVVLAERAGASSTVVVVDSGSVVEVVEVVEAVGSSGVGTGRPPGTAVTARTPSTTVPRSPRRIGS